MDLLIKQINIEQIIPLRAKILRNGITEKSRFPHDEDETTIHFGVIENDNVVSIASLYKENYKNTTGTGYRLRGMATENELQNKGYGNAILNNLIEKVKELNGDYIWCNARSTAVNFYLKNNFEIISDEFGMPDIGPHFVMMLRLKKSSLSKSVRDIEIKKYSYRIPFEKIAYYPEEKRDNAKLLIYKDGKIIDDKFYNALNYFPEDSLIVFNDSKVVHARIFFETSEGTKIELFIIEPFDTKDYTKAFNTKGHAKWECMVGNLRKWKEPVLTKIIDNGYTKIILKAKKNFLSNKFIVEFIWEPAYLNFSEIVNIFGMTPLPPYIKRDAEKSDDEKYQTIYANQEGSVAAPTAGLHFTPEFMNKLNEKNIKQDFVTLHVSAGTFLPVKGETIGKHKMHPEWIIINKKIIEDLYERDFVISTGTTSLRTLESLYWISYLILNKKITDEAQEIKINQWMPYETEYDVPKKFALKTILDFMEKNNLDKITASTSLLIVPGYKFKMVDALITNFHQPQSTLLLLVSAFIGENWRKIYKHALEKDYRLFSFGDSSLLFKNK
ncbi:MAG TPA: GNAT family N-acetyltransferase [Ignavibacteria bacterium]|nr:GNAT family N-acetyltransferase [Ignavibacteria bacterium]